MVAPCPPGRGSTSEAPACIGGLVHSSDIAMSLVESAAQFAPHPFVTPYAFEPARARDAVRGTVELDLSLRYAGQRKLRVGYEAVGPVDAPAVLVAGGISADRHVI